MLDIGIKPFIEFGFCPEVMVSGKSTQFWWKSNVTPPKNHEKWTALLTKAIYHWIDRYGIGEVRQWYFEVWNGPDFLGFWDGTKSQYLELYKKRIYCFR